MCLLSRTVIFSVLAALVDSKPVCEACTKLTTRFLEELQKTNGISSGAGNTDWEESRGIKWDTSDARLAEILERVCGKSDSKCLEILEEKEEVIEDWWAKRKFSNGNMNVSLHSFLCIEKVKVCCEKGSYGKYCKDCPGGKDTPCSNHGKCIGSGDRTGKGTCNCDSSYIGKRCAKCAHLHFKLKTTTTNFTCNKCHVSCSESCSGPTENDCTACSTGYTLNGGCKDINECEGMHNCSKATYCSNSQGSFTCESCNRACDQNYGCKGPGASDCIGQRCASGYLLSGEECIDIDECTKKNSCKDGEFCTNIPGSHTCNACHIACSPSHGCSGASQLDCLGCESGWTVPEGRFTGCEDVDECRSNEACSENMICSNTLGSFTCHCEDGRQMNDGRCVEQNKVAATSGDSKLAKIEL